MRQVFLPGIKDGITQDIPIAITDTSLINDDITYDLDIVRSVLFNDRFTHPVFYIGNNTNVSSIELKKLLGGCDV